MIEKILHQRKILWYAGEMQKFYAYPLQVASFEDETFVRRVECNTPNFKPWFNTIFLDYWDYKEHQKILIWLIYVIINLEIYQENLKWINWKNLNKYAC